MLKNEKVYNQVIVTLLNLGLNVSEFTTPDEDSFVLSKKPFFVEGVQVEDGIYITIEQYSETLQDYVEIFAKVYKTAKPALNKIRKVLLV